MEHFINIKTYSQQQQDMVIFVPMRMSPSCSSLLKRLCTMAKKFRKVLSPAIHTSVISLTTVILVFFHGLFIFLLLLLDITIQDSFTALDCWNSSRTGYITPYQATIWSSIDVDLKRPLQVTTSILVTVFLLECSLRVFVSGKRIIRQYWEIFDCLIVLICFSLNMSSLVSFTIGKQVAQFIILFRLWRTLELFAGGSFSAKALNPSQYSPGNPSLRQQMSSSSTTAMCETTAYAHDQNVGTLMLRIEELEQQLTELNRGVKTATVCQRCINHNWTTDDLLKMACMQLSRSESRYREDLRATKSISMDDLSIGGPESGYSSTQRTGYPALIYRVSQRIQGQQAQLQQRPLQTVVDIEGILMELASGEARQSVSELAEIQRIAQIEFCPDSKLQDIPVTSL